MDGPDAAKMVRATWAYRIGLVAVAVAVSACAVTVLILLLHLAGVASLSWLALPLTCLGIAVFLGWAGVIGQIVRARRLAINMTDPAYVFAMFRFASADVRSLATRGRFVNPGEAPPRG